MEPLFRTQDLVFQNMIRYPDLIFPAGCATFLTGPSGCGKSTLLHLMNGTLSPSQGRIFYRGRNVEELDTIALRREVLLARQSAFLFNVSIRENFAEYHRYRGEAAPGEAEMRGWLDTCLADFPLDQNGATLSGGERQRVHLAVCLSFRPKVLLLDEPTSALDAGTGQELMKRLVYYGKENHITIIVVSHDQALTATFAEEIVTLPERRGA